MNVALPEFDGRIISVAISFKEETQTSRNGPLNAKLQRYVPRKDRVDLVARLAVKWAAAPFANPSEKNRPSV